MEELPKPVIGMPESVVKLIKRHASRWGTYLALKNAIQAELNRRGIPAMSDPSLDSFSLRYPEWMQKNLMLVFQCAN